MPELVSLEQRVIESTPRGTLSQSFRQVADWTSIQLAYQVCNDKLKRLRARGALDEHGNVNTVKLKEALADPNEALSNPNNPNFLLNWFGWTGTGAMYTVENGKAVLYLSNDVRNNLVLRPENIAKAIKQLKRLRGYWPRRLTNYRPNEKDASEVKESVSAGTTARVEYDADSLRLINDTNDLSYFEVNTVNYDKPVEEGGLNGDQRELAERTWGNGEKYNEAKGFSNEFRQYMAILNAAGKKTTNFFILNPEYVKAYAKKGAICRVSWLFNFNLDHDDDFDSSFLAVDRLDDTEGIGGLRGLLTQVA